MPEINGKQVILKDKLTAEDWWPIMPKLQGMAGKDGSTVLSALDLDTVRAMVKGAIKSWEFEGDPSDPEAVGRLDTFQELIPLINAISTLVSEKTQRLGESASAST